VGTDEVGRLATSFNTMLSALATSREQQKRLVADASHELRTPLTALRTNIEFLERAGTLPAGEQAALLAEARLELTELTVLVSELVDLAGDARVDEPVTAVDLAEVAEDVATRFRRRTGRDVTVAASDAAVIDGRRAMIDRALSNLVDNALKFTGQPVEIIVSGGRIDVADRGPGIGPDDRERVFDRFYRASSDRTKPGSGLGLSIVSQIAAAHGGRASMHERAGGGNIARLELS
jgi:two-component system sensor histidine kinase MprB